MIRRACRLVLASLTLGSISPAGAEQGAQPKGALVIIGGNLRPGNAPVWERIIQLAGGGLQPKKMAEEHGHQNTDPDDQRAGQSSQGQALGLRGSVR